MDELGRYVWHSVANCKLQLTKKERDLLCQGFWLKERQRLVPEDFTSCLRILKLTDTREVVQDVQRWHRMEKRQSHNNDECRERIRTIIESTLTGKARINAYKDRIAETERVKERRRDRV